MCYLVYSLNYLVLPLSTEVAGLTSFSFTVSTCNCHFFQLEASSFLKTSIFGQSFNLLAFVFPLFLFPVTSKFNAFKMLPFSLHKICPYHFTSCRSYHSFNRYSNTLQFCVLLICQLHSAHGSYHSSFQFFKIVLLFYLIISCTSNITLLI